MNIHRRAADENRHIDNDFVMIRMRQAEVDISVQAFSQSLDFVNLRFGNFADLVAQLGEGLFTDKL
jgi:hypothetical protein